MFLRAFTSAVSVPALCAIIAVIEVFAAYGGTLTPWKGGGFGMFAVIDGPGNRTLSITAVDVDGRQFRVAPPNSRVSIPEALSSRSLSRAMAMPSLRALENIGRAILASKLAVKEESASIPMALLGSRWGALLKAQAPFPRLEIIGRRKSEDRRPDIRTVEVAVLRWRFDSKRMVSVAEAVGLTATVPWDESERGPK